MAEQSRSRGQDETADRQRRGGGTPQGDLAVGRLSDDDLHRVESRAAALKERFSSTGPLARYVNDAKELAAMVGDIVRGHYRHAPGWAIAALAAAAAYVLNPFDLVPDVIPLLGVVDDATVIAACLLLFEQEIASYRRWRTAMDE